MGGGFATQFPGVGQEQVGVDWLTSYRSFDAGNYFAVDTAMADFGGLLEFFIDIRGDIFDRNVRHISHLRYGCSMEPL
jgi:hypothetical protein